MRTASEAALSTSCTLRVLFVACEMLARVLFDDLFALGEAAQVKCFDLGSLGAAMPPGQNIWLRTSGIRGQFT